jgi:site-specific DNA-methyltransferase (adenine-specific)
MNAAAAATVTLRWRAATSIAGRVFWRTPEALYRALHQEFDFTLDAAADDGNAVCDRFLDAERDALAQSWAGERVFCNPPYGRDLTRWLEKAANEAQTAGALVVMVLPSRTGNSWFHRWVLPHAEIRFIRGRQNFTIGGSGRCNAPFDSMVVVFRPFSHGAGSFATQPVFPFLRGNARG